MLPLRCVAGHAAVPSTGSNVTLTLAKTDHGDLCHGWSWTVTNQDELAERVARVALGQYRHVAKILSGAGVPGPTANAEQAKAAIKLLTRGKNEEPWHRDGWIFQAISWIAANQAPSGALTRAPHIRRAERIRWVTAGAIWRRQGGYRRYRLRR